MRARTLVRAQAVAIVTLLGVLTTGVPSHHHGEAGRIPILVDANHHGHGVKLVELTEKLTAHPIVAALPSRPVLEFTVPAPVFRLAGVQPSPPAPSGRPPPTDRPRGPPLSD